MRRWVLAAGVMGMAVLCVVSAAQGQARLPDVEVQHVEAHIDWQQGLVTATALFPVPDHDDSVKAAQSLALQSATLAARRRLLEALGGPTGVEPPHLMDPLEWRALQELYGILEGSQIVSGVILQDGTARVTMAAWFDRNRAHRAQRMGPEVLTNVDVPSIRMLVTRQRRLAPAVQVRAKGAVPAQHEAGSASRPAMLPKNVVATTDSAGAWEIRRAVRR